MTELQRRFIEEYIKDYNGTRAYLRVSPDVSEGAAKSCASKLLKKQDCLDYLKTLQREVVKQYGDLGELIISQLMEDVIARDADGNHSPTWSKSVSLAQKQLGLETTNIKADIDQKVSINITVEDEDE